MDFKKIRIVFSGDISAKSGGGGEVKMKQFRYLRRLPRDGDDEGAATEEEAPAIAQYDRPRRSARLALTESQIEEKYGDAYDQPKESDPGYADDGEEPFRFLTDWYLFNPTNPNVRLPLPHSTQYFPKTRVLAGWLLPSPDRRKTHRPIFVELEDVTFYSMDRSPEYRGYWVNTGTAQKETNALYWLQEPCTDRPPAPHSLSQADVHFPARMVLAIVTALCERVFSGKDKNANVKKTVEKVLETIPLLKTKNVTVDELQLFEKRLLAKYQSAVAMHLNGYVPDKLEAKSTFMQSLTRLHQDKNKLNEVDLFRWTVAIEKQTKQHSWGGPLGPKAHFEFAVNNDRKSVREVVEYVALPARFHDTVGNLFKVAIDNAEASETGDESSLEDESEAGARKESDSRKRESKKRKVAVTSSEHSDERKRRPLAATTETSTKRSRVTDSRGVGALVDGSDINDIVTDRVTALEGGNGANYWSGCLIPQLGVSDLKNGFCLTDDSDRAYGFFDKLAAFDLESMPLKDALLAVESLNRSFAMENRSKEYTDILKGFFKVKKDTRWLAQIVFDDFRDHCLNILRLRGANRTQREGTAAMLLLVSIVKLIVNCNHIIKHQGHYKKLLERGLDWEQGISKIRGFASRGVSQDEQERVELLEVLGKALDRAQETVTTIKTTEKGKSAHSKHQS